MTPSSVTVPLVVIVFLALGIGMFAVGQTIRSQPDMKTQQLSQQVTKADEECVDGTDCSTPEGPSQYPDTSQKVTEQFYTEYLTCLEERELKKDDTNMHIDCLANSNRYLLSEYAKALAAERTAAFDPVLCSSNLPDKVGLDQSQTNTASATVTIVEQFPDRQQSIEIEVLKQKSGQWQITAIHCP